MTVIHALPVGGGILALAPMPGADGDFAADLEHILDWTPALVISLATTNEMAAAGAGDLGPRLQQRATRWLHIPVPDMEAPDDEATALWADASRFACRALTGGGRVLIHCKAGIGRSGMAALRLMIEAGEAPDEALDRLRAVRPGAVETDAQLHWAMSAPREAARFVRGKG
ncbi:dual specificity protein phosphatase family protein [Roseivivax marinus]|uniref:protein-tyrosine phosphatase family protein n=1 Tax=Roseivivax marinus TaxID=1379903 RepID=UPI001F043D88|nr:dual specificity protein phosphatase family protein [Roseivivax marinus]UMA64152.1 dual specificity protein phosphatase family protein [Roseivivax marinus]